VNHFWTANKKILLERRSGVELVVK